MSPELSASGSEGCPSSEVRSSVLSAEGRGAGPGDEEKKTEKKKNAGPGDEGRDAGLGGEGKFAGPGDEILIVGPGKTAGPTMEWIVQPGDQKQTLCASVDLPEMQEWSLQVTEEGRKRWPVESIVAHEQGVVFCVAKVSG